MSFEDFFDMPQFDYDKEKKKFIDNMERLKAMTVEEQTLYKKWVEISTNYKWASDVAGIVKANIWRPSNLTDPVSTKKEFDALNPTIEFVDPTDKKGMEEWLVLRVFVHSMEFSQNPGRFLRFIVKDATTGKYLGASSLGSDVVLISVRDEYIGWDEQAKLEKGRLNNTAIATTIMSTQPFGYNFLGGKLIASLMTTKAVQDAWEKLYSNKLVGVTTTSLYGAHSMYQRIPFWKELGETGGKVFIKPDDSVYEVWHHYFQEHYPEVYHSMTDSFGPTHTPPTGVKQKIISFIMKELDMTQSHYAHGFKRGVYFAPLYENSREFLKGDIEEKDLIPLKKLDRDRDAVLDWWREKAWKRYENLLKQDRLNGDILFYNKMLSQTWNKSKELYLGEVGR